MFSFSTTAYDSVEKLTAPNLKVVKTTLAENEAIVNKALLAKPEELFSLTTSLAMPTSEKVAAYSRQVYEIISSTGTELASTAQAQFNQSQREAKGFVSGLSRASPFGNAIAMAE